MAQRIMCTVSNCHYWKDGNECAAEEILVTSDSFANYSPPSIDATTASTLSATPTNTCMETACKTFVARGASRREKRADNVLEQKTTQNQTTNQR